MNMIELALKVQIIVITSFIKIYIKMSESHLKSSSNSSTTKRVIHTDNNKKESPAKIVSKTTPKRNNITDTPMKKGKPRTKIKARDKTITTPK